jgi:hypothetical protein
MLHSDRLAILSVHLTDDSLRRLNRGAIELLSTARSTWLFFQAVRIVSKSIGARPFWLVEMGLTLIERTTGENCRGWQINSPEPTRKRQTIDVRIEVPLESNSAGHLFIRVDSRSFAAQTRLSVAKSNL